MCTSVTANANADLVSVNETLEFGATNREKKRSCILKFLLYYDYYNLYYIIIICTILYKETAIFPRLKLKVETMKLK